MSQVLHIFAMVAMLKLEVADSKWKLALKIT